MFISLRWYRLNFIVGSRAWWWCSKGVQLNRHHWMSWLRGDCMGRKYKWGQNAHGWRVIQSQISLRNNLCDLYFNFRNKWTDQSKWRTWIIMKVLVSFKFKKVILVQLTLFKQQRLCKRSLQHLTSRWSTKKVRRCCTIVGQRNRLVIPYIETIRTE